MPKAVICHLHNCQHFRSSKDEWRLTQNAYQTLHKCEDLKSRNKTWSVDIGINGIPGWPIVHIQSNKKYRPSQYQTETVSAQRASHPFLLHRRQWGSHCRRWWTALWTRPRIRVNSRQPSCPVASSRVPVFGVCKYRNWWKGRIVFTKETESC